MCTERDEDAMSSRMQASCWRPVFKKKKAQVQQPLHLLFWSDCMNNNVIAAAVPLENRAVNILK
jgi:hypothetical protein